jgi:hypothetical protein
MNNKRQEFSLEEAQKKADKRRNAKYLKKILAYKKVFATEQGITVLDDLMVSHGMLSSRPGNMTTPNELFFNEGERNVVLRILKMIEMNPETLRKRIREIESQ